MIGQITVVQVEYLNYKLRGLSIEVVEHVFDYTIGVKTHNLAVLHRLNIRQAQKIIEYIKSRDFLCYIRGTSTVGRCRNIWEEV